MGTGGSCKICKPVGINLNDKSHFKSTKRDEGSIRPMVIKQAKSTETDTIDTGLWKEIQNVALPDRGTLALSGKSWAESKTRLEDGSEDKNRLLSSAEKQKLKEGKVDKEQAIENTRTSRRLQQEILMLEENWEEIEESSSTSSKGTVSHKNSGDQAVKKKSFDDFSSGTRFSSQLFSRNADTISGTSRGSGDRFLYSAKHFDRTLALGRNAGTEWSCASSAPHGSSIASTISALSDAGSKASILTDSYFLRSFMTKSEIARLKMIRDMALTGRPFETRPFEQMKDLRLNEEVTSGIAKTRPGTNTFSKEVPKDKVTSKGSKSEDEEEEASSISKESKSTKTQRTLKVQEEEDETPRMNSLCDAIKLALSTKTQSSEEILNDVNKTLSKDNKAAEQSISKESKGAVVKTSSTAHSSQRPETGVIFAMDGESILKKLVLRRELGPDSIHVKVRFTPVTQRMRYSPITVFAKMSWPFLTLIRKALADKQRNTTKGEDPLFDWVFNYNVNKDIRKIKSELKMVFGPRFIEFRGSHLKKKIADFLDDQTGSTSFLINVWVLPKPT